jgi:hypothetical protein
VPGEQSTFFDQVVVDMGGAQARGSLELGSDQSLISAKFPQIRFSPGDDMKLDIAKAGDTLKLTVRGTAIDARPFLKPFAFASGGGTAPAGGAGGGSSSVKEQPAFKDIDLDLKSKLLTGFNKQVMIGAELRVAKHGDQLRQFALAGHFGREAIEGSLSGSGTAAPQLDLSTTDAGTLLSFLDLYRHMEHGRLSVAMRLGDGGLAGALDIKDFILRDEPALRRLVTEGVPSRGPGNDSGAAAVKIDAGAVSFNKLQVNFQRAGSRLDLRDGTMYGANIGLTVDGWLDFAQNRVDMHGTFVPAYAVNNLFSQIPVFGMLLGGGSHEGLFAVNYRVAGQASAPTLSINPLSAIAPGFLRKIFGVGVDPGAQTPRPASSDPSGQQ